MNDSPEHAPLIGAKAIAGHLKLTPRQVYMIAEKPARFGNAPIRKVPGMGIISDKTHLDIWWRDYIGGGKLNN